MLLHSSNTSRPDQTRPDLQNVTPETTTHELQDDFAPLSQESKLQTNVIAELNAAARAAQPKESATAAVLWGHSTFWRFVWLYIRSFDQFLCTSAVYCVENWPYLPVLIVTTFGVCSPSKGSGLRYSCRGGPIFRFS